MKKKSEPRCNLGEQNLVKSEQDFEQDQKVAIRKATHHAMVRSKMLRRRNDSGRKPKPDIIYSGASQKMTVCQFLTHGILFDS